MGTKAESCSPSPHSASAGGRMLEIHGKCSLQALGSSNTHWFMEQLRAMKG